MCFTMVVGLTQSIDYTNGQVNLIDITPGMPIIRMHLGAMRQSANEATKHHPAFLLADEDKKELIVNTPTSLDNKVE